MIHSVSVKEHEMMRIAVEILIKALIQAIIVQSDIKAVRKATNLEKKNNEY